MTIIWRARYAARYKKRAQAYANKLKAKGTHHVRVKPSKHYPGANYVVFTHKKRKGMRLPENP